MVQREDWNLAYREMGASGAVIEEARKGNACVEEPMHNDTEGVLLLCIFGPDFCDWRRFSVTRDTERTFASSIWTV